MALLLSRCAVLSLAIGLSALPPVHAGAADERAPRLLHQTTYAIVMGDIQAQELAARVGMEIDAAAPRIASIVGTGDLRPVRAYVYRDRDAFRQAVGVPRESTLVGIAILPSGVIHIDGTGLLASIQKVVPHEVGHVMIARAVGPALPQLPLWLNEGIAEYVAGQRAAQVDPVALRAVGRGDALRLADLDPAFRRRDASAALAYAQSASLVNFLVAERGERVIADLLAALRASRDFDSALQQATGFTSPELESAWRSSVARRWRWLLLFRSGSLVLTLMLVLFLVGFVRYLRERRRRQEMPEQDW
jgi:hypothetical protein